MEKLLLLNSIIFYIGTLLGVTSYVLNKNNFLEKVGGIFIIIASLVLGTYIFSIIVPQIFALIMSILILSLFIVFGYLLKPKKLLI